MVEKETWNIDDEEHKDGIFNNYHLYKGELFGSVCHLAYEFEGNLDSSKLVSIAYTIYDLDDENRRILMNKVSKVLECKYGNKAENYEEPTWVIDNGQTAIEVRNREDGPLYVSIRIFNNENSSIREKRVDHHKEAMERF